MQISQLWGTLWQLTLKYNQQPSVVSGPMKNNELSRSVSKLSIEYILRTTIQMRNELFAWEAFGQSLTESPKRKRLFLSPFHFHFYCRRFGLVWEEKGPVFLAILCLGFVFQYKRSSGVIWDGDLRWGFSVLCLVYADLDLGSLLGLWLDIFCSCTFNPVT